MKVEVLHAEKIRPSSPTPHSLKSYKLSLVDQLSYNVKVPVIVFYHEAHISHGGVDALKKSLSQTLSDFYPLAGRLNDDRLTISCSDEGVDFLEAEVDGNMCGILRNPEIEILRQLIPCNPHTGSFEFCPDDRVLVIQVNKFACGGVAIGIIISHAIADASSAAAFFNAWASIHRRVDDNKTNRSSTSGCAFVDTSAIFPPFSCPADAAYVSEVASGAHGEAKSHCTMKRFVFPDSAIAKLRDEAEIKNGGGSPEGRRPTRIETLTAFIWTAVIKATRESHHGSRETKIHVVGSVVNFRNRMVPPLPPNCLGNNTIATAARWETPPEGIKILNWPSMVGRIRDSIRAVDDGYVRKKYRQEVCMAMWKEAIEMTKRSREEKESYFLSAISWCRIPFYETNFGWGKPRWVVTPVLQRDAVIFLDGAEDNGGGVEAWMGLPKEVMDIVEDILHNFLA